MDEYQALAVAALEALQAANQPTWTEVASLWSTTVIGLLQCGLLFYGLRLMGQTGQRRDKQLDVLTKGLEEQSAGIRALLERSRS